MLLRACALSILSFGSFLFLDCSFLARLLAKKSGVVTFYKSIPPDCPNSKGLNQKVIKPVYSEQELIKHYGISFLIQFRDKNSPKLYGTLYHLDKEKNLYCMALPDGRFAQFHNIKVDGKDNTMQEICHPLKRCQLQ